MTDHNGNPLQPATYRGKRVLVDTSMKLLSDPLKYNIQYVDDGQRDYAVCDEVEFDNAECAECRSEYKENGCDYWNHPPANCALKAWRKKQGDAP